MHVEQFRQLTLFQDLTAEQLAFVKPLFVPCSRAQGEVIFEQGDPADFLYLLLDGEVVVHFKPDDGPALVVAHIRPEGVVGWSAALGSRAYTSSAECATDCEMLQIRGEDLRQLCEQQPETGNLLLERLAVVIAERLRNTHNHVIALLEQGLRLNNNNPAISEQLT